MSRDINNNQDVIDSREVIARITELEEEREALSEALADAQGAEIPLDDEDNAAVLEHEAEVEVASEALKDWDDSSEGLELAALKALESEAEGYSDWPHGVALIRDTYFEDYAQQTAEELGLIPQDGGWPVTCIDWEKAALELQMDYTSVDFNGATYWVRS